MKCTVCDTKLSAAHSNLPFKVSDQTIVILKSLPVLRCENRPQYRIEDRAFSRVEQILTGVDSATELEIIRYAAVNRIGKEVNFFHKSYQGDITCPLDAVQ